MEDEQASSDGRLAGTITSLKVQANDQTRVNVYLDGHFAVGLSATTVAGAGLKKGDYLSAERVAVLLQGESRERALQQAFNYLSYRPRSEHELRRYLSQKGHAPETIDAVMRKLVDYHYVDDQVFAVSWVENRQRFRPSGPRLLRAELRLKGVDRTVVDQAIADVANDEKTLALQAAIKRAENLKGAAYPEFSRKLGGFLARRGFSTETVWEVVRQLWAVEAGHSPDGDEVNLE
jgi:regulatory protein